MKKYEITYHPPDAMVNTMIFFVKANNMAEAKEKARKRLQERIHTIIEATFLCGMRGEWVNGKKIGIAVNAVKKIEVTDENK